MPRATTSRDTKDKPYDRKAINYFDKFILASDSEEKDEIDSEPDVKPDVSEESDTKPKGTPKKAAKGKGVSPKKETAKKNPSPKKAGGAKWMPEEDWALFCQMHRKVSKVDWTSIAAAVGGGRDGKSCQNRYYQWDKNGKLEAAIKRMN